MADMMSYLEEFMEFLMAEPLYIGGLVILGLIIVGALAKKMIKIAIIGVLLSLGYVYYLHDYALESYRDAQTFTGKLQRGVEGAVKGFESAGDKVKDAVNR